LPDQDHVDQVANAGGAKQTRQTVPLVLQLPGLPGDLWFTIHQARQYHRNASKLGHDHANQSLA
jgi:hypothetical protein